MPKALGSPFVGNTGSWTPPDPRAARHLHIPVHKKAPQCAAVPLTETDVVGEEVQEALALVLPVPAGVAGAPGSNAGG